MDNYPKSVTKESTRIIYNQMNDSFYEIKGKDNKYGIGLFCQIIIKNKIIFILITNYRLIDEKYIENNCGIRIKTNDKSSLIQFGDKRLKYINKENDLTVIEIKKNKKIKLNCLELDESLYEEESKILQNKDSIYILHYNKEKKISVSYGIINYINKFEFLFSCNINSDGAISPIFNLDSNKLIGIYINNSKYFIKGLFLNFIIDKFTKIFNTHKNIFENKNEIDILIKIYKEDINKKIYFLNNEFFEYRDNHLQEYYNDEEFNELIAELYMDDKIIPFKKYFLPDKEGEYKIKLKFNINLIDSSYMFSGCENIIKLDFISFNTFFIKNMKYMFFGCTNLKEINLLSFDTSNVMDMSYMFYECENLINLDLSSFNSKSVIDMHYMFYNCKNLRNLYLSNFNIKNKYNCEGMFYNCNKLNDINSSSFNKKIFNDSEDISYFKAKYIFNSHLSNKSQELIEFLLHNIVNNENLLKSNVKKIKNKYPFIPSILKYTNSNINSNFILISNDIILIPKKKINNRNEKTPNSIFFPQIKEDIEYSSYNFIIENSNYDNNYILIKVLNKNFLFENHLKLPNDDFNSENIKSRQKYYINENQEEVSLGIIITDNIINKIKIECPGSPIYIKRANQLYLIGVINKKNKLYFYTKQELFDIKKSIENIEFKLNFHYIKKIDFINREINDSDMSFIFQYGFSNLEYLNLENNNITNKGMKHLMNKSLINIKYLNLSNNPIDDQGLTFLNYLYNLNELILYDMDKLSEDYFSSLESNSFINRINDFKCDKNKLTLKYINSNYNNFFLPNLTCLKIISKISYDALEKLITLNNICSKIIYLDLSNTSLTDEGLYLLNKNISIFKKIEEINLLNNNFTSKKEKYLTELRKQKIKIKISEIFIKEYNILLGGSTFSGKSSYFNSYITKEFRDNIISTMGIIKRSIKELNQAKFFLYDCPRWNRNFIELLKKYIKKADGIILLFDISKKEDFNDLPNLLKMINKYHKLEEFPVLLIGNKADLEINVDKTEIKEFIKERKFIHYFEVSCKNHINVEESVNFMVNYIFEKRA